MFSIVNRRNCNSKCAIPNSRNSGSQKNNSWLSGFLGYWGKITLYSDMLLF